jgi:hypothetical protein
MQNIKKIEAGFYSTDSYATLEAAKKSGGYYPAPPTENLKELLLASKFAAAACDCMDGNYNDSLRMHVAITTDTELIQFELPIKEIQTFIQSCQN